VLGHGASLGEVFPHQYRCSRGKFSR
jgi:hypothetical protein